MKKHCFTTLAEALLEKHGYYALKTCVAAGIDLTDYNLILNKEVAPPEKLKTLLVTLSNRSWDQWEELTDVKK